MAPDSAVTGRFYAFDFGSSSPADQIAAVYEDLAAAYDPRNILVLKRIPCSLESLADHIRLCLDQQIRPNIQSVPQHASYVVEMDNPDIDRLAYEQRIELLSGLTESTNWERLLEEAETRFGTLRWPGAYQRTDILEFLETASTQDSFGKDVGQVLLEATRQGGFRIDYSSGPHALIAVLACLNDRFHDRLRDHGLVERANIIPRATRALEDETTYEQVAAGFEAILAVEFEEYAENDRRYLANLAADAELVAVGERNASIQRIKTEPGSVDDIREHCCIDFEVAEMPAKRLERTDHAETAPGAIGSFLATGREPTTSVSVIHLHESTFGEQLRTVANEIEHLRARNELAYSEFAVVLNSVGDQLSDARRQLRASGLPTRTVGAPALAEDPAVTELYAFVQYLLNRDTDAESWLRARVTEFSPELAEACNHGTLEARLNRWIINTDLKQRVATGESHIEIQEQFRNIERITDLAKFIDQTSLLESDLPTFKHVLQRAIRFDGAYTHTIETAPQRHGITVTDVQGIKHDTYNTVFVLNVIDQTYPGTERLTPLFPTPWLTEMPGYPAVTEVDDGLIAGTFETAGGERSTSGFDAYYHHRERRKLALGVRAASDNLYVCSYDSEESGLGRAHTPSRYLYALSEQPQISLEALSMTDRPIRTRQNVAEYVLDQPWAELEAIVNAAHTGETAAIEETEAVFGAIQTLLADEDVDPVFAEAVASQFALARGEVIDSA